MQWVRNYVLAGLIVAGLCASASAQSGPLKEAFSTPPEAAKPRVWWHWLDGNVSWEGAQKDLTWMKRVGVGGAQMIDAALGTPQVVKERVGYLSPQWRDAFRKSVELAASLGMDFDVGASPGWSLTGGPWVKPEQAMKKVVWSETTIEGGRPLDAALPRPPQVAGPFQNIVVGPGAPSFYRDVAVFAFPARPTDVPLRPAITSGGSALDATTLTDGDVTKFLDVPFSKGGGATIEFTFVKAQTVRAFTFVISRAPGLGPFPATGPKARLEASEDGKTFRKLADLPTQGADQQTIAFAPATAKRFRLVLQPIRSAVPAFAGPPVAAPKAFRIAELALLAGAHVDRWEDKAGFSAQPGLAARPATAGFAPGAMKRAGLLNLTGKLRSDDRLDWTPPEGKWVILRIGYSLTGKLNNPASPEGTGLEVDKLSRAYVKAYLDAYLGEYEKILGPDLVGKRGLRGLNVDSWESGVQNWTDDMVAEFTRRRGYDPTPWLPVLTGRIVDDAPSSERFLWDFRTTIGELTTDEHFGQIARSARERGLSSAVESHEQSRVFIGDGMAARKFADIPMAAMWIEAPNPGAEFAREMDVREAASVAHLRGRPLVAAEAFTTLGNPYGYSPAEIKPTADKLLSLGVNRFFIHTSVHQPVDGAGPGIGLGPFGQWFTRRETWAEEAAPWLSYLARSSYLMQQGRAVADIAYFYGEDDNVTALYGAHSPGIPEGFGYDFVDADSLLTLMSVKDGEIVTAGGAAYRVLVLGPETRRMTLRVLKKIRALVDAGATVVGAKPLQTPSLADDPAEFAEMSAALWSGSKTGKGHVIVSTDLSKTLAALSLAPDVRYARSRDDAPLAFSHRRIDGGDMYFLSNRSTSPRTIDVSFRLAGKAPEIWRADTGSVADLSYRVENGRTVVPLQLAANDAVFVVFRQVAGATSRTVTTSPATVVATLDGSWDVSFAPGLGAPAKARFDSLLSWTQNADAGIKYFSGTATYEKDIQIAAGALQDGKRVLLDLGDVKNLAEVKFNGQAAGTVWKAPFVLDVTALAAAGANHLQVKVTNLWVNRLIGDKQPDASAKIASAAFDPLPPTGPLSPSGLLGPVRLLSEQSH